MKIHKICLIGCGVAGTILLLKLLETIAPEDICVIDPAFDGGDLMRHWSDVKSNTTWQQFLDATDKLSVAKPIIDRRRDKFDPTKITPVWELSRSLSLALNLSLKMMDANTCYGRIAAYNSETSTWKIQLESPGCKGIRYAKILLFAPGGVPKQVNLTKHQILLEIALDSTRLARSIEPGQHVLVFGLSHSGTLVVRNLIKLGVKVSVVYRTPQPFMFSRDGVYTGLKQESAVFADELLANPLDTQQLEFIKSDDAEATIRAYSKCDAVISAIGFIKNTSTCAFTVDENPIDISAYDTKTGALTNAPNAFGIGIAYPSTTLYQGKIYEDAGVTTFVNHALEMAPEILEKVAAL